MKTPIAVLTLLLATGAHAAPKTYDIDPVHTRIAFSCRHLDFSNALGTFAHPTGTLVFDDKDWSASRVEVTVAIDSLDLGDDAWEKRMHKRDFFHLEKFAQARFVSTRVEKTGERTLRVHGDLTLRGKTAPLVLEASLNDLGRHPYTFKSTVGFSARAVLKRSEFGMISLPNVVADAVELRIEAEATRAKQPGES